MQKNILTIELSGSIDTYNSQDSEREIRSQIQNSDADDVILDISGVNYMSSTGVGAFVNLNMLCHSLGKKLYLMGMAPKLHEVFSLLGFISFFKLIESPDDIEKESESLFPKEVKCPSCGKLLNIIKSGRFKCPSCKSILRVDKQGDIKKE